MELRTIYDHLGRPLRVPQRRWSIGIDIGQASDPTALCVIETIKYVAAAGRGARYSQDVSYEAQVAAERQLDSITPATAYHIRGLKRLPLGMAYPDQCLHIGALISDPQLRDARIFVDATGVGKPIVDLFERMGIKHTPIWITGGRDEQEHRGGLSVPKLHLVSRLQAALHAQELKIATALPEANAFTRELQEFRCNFTESGYLQFGARQGAHDDLVLAAALALYGATREAPAMSIDLPLAYSG